MVPHDVTRALFPWETSTNFAAIELGIDSAAAALAVQLHDDRARMIDLLAADLAAAGRNPGDMPPAVAIAYRVLALNSELGLDAIPGAAALLADAEARYRGTLAASAAAGGQQVAGEAAAQGVDLGMVKVKLGRLDEYRLDLAARRLSQQPQADVLKAAADLAYRMPDPAALARTVIDQLRDLSTDRLGAYARPPVQQADGIGRQAAATGGGGGSRPNLVLPERIYSSELLDRNTCGPCSMVDGQEYDTLADARADYPTGQYRKCDGGDLCRGTLVFVWSSEAAPGE